MNMEFIRYDEVVENAIDGVMVVNNVEDEMVNDDVNGVVNARDEVAMEFVAFFFRKNTQ